MLKNITNHPSSRWGAKQLETAIDQFSSVEDLGFPNVPATASTKEVEAMAEAVVSDLNEGDSVLVQGEMSLTFHITTKAKAKGVNVFVACSDRNVVEQLQKDGTTRKVSTFEFVQFRSV